MQPAAVFVDSIEGVDHYRIGGKVRPLPPVHLDPLFTTPRQEYSEVWETFGPAHWQPATSSGHNSLCRSQDPCYFLRNLDDLATALQNNHPCTITFPIGETFGTYGFFPNESNAVILPYTERIGWLEGEPLQLWQSERTKEWFFHVRLPLSWGTDFAAHGCIDIPADYLKGNFKGYCFAPKPVVTNTDPGNINKGDFINVIAPPADIHVIHASDGSLTHDRSY